MIRGQPGYFPLHLNGRLLGRNIEGKKKPNRRKEDRGEEGDNGVGGMI